MADDFTIRPFDDALAPDFHRINAAWIEAMFRLEPTDLDVLLHPRERIVDPGGAVLFLEAPGEGVIGTVALQKTGERQFELTKMGVTAAAQGRGAGEALLRAALAEAARLGAERLYLLTSSKCATAIRMYERNGFVHDPDVMREFGGRYARCDVAMLYAGQRYSREKMSAWASVRPSASMLASPPEPMRSSSHAPERVR